MIQLILKNDIEKNKIDVLLSLLKSWNIEAEMKTITPTVTKKESVFSLSEGIWKDYNIDAKELRKKSWNRA
jgi:hypothetical protein